jgi:hypothetical protein
MMVSAVTVSWREDYSNFIAVSTRARRTPQDSALLRPARDSDDGVAQGPLLGDRIRSVVVVCR